MDKAFDDESEDDGEEEKDDDDDDEEGEDVQMVELDGGDQDS